MAACKGILRYCRTAAESLLLVVECFSIPTVFHSYLNFPSINSHFENLHSDVCVKDALAERLRIKAELKKKASKPMGYKESMEAEKNKQISLKKSKEEQRRAMCEELGRGC